MVCCRSLRLFWGDAWYHQILQSKNFWTYWQEDTSFYSHVHCWLAVIFLSLCYILCVEVFSSRCNMSNAVQVAYYCRSCKCKCAKDSQHLNYVLTLHIYSSTLLSTFPYAWVSLNGAIFAAWLWIWMVLLFINKCEWLFALYCSWQVANEVQLIVPEIREALLWNSILRKAIGT